MNPRVLLGLVLAAAVAPQAAAQSFNIDFGQPGAGPPDTYAAAGQPGHWISIPGTQGVQYLDLVDVNGVVTPVHLSQIGGTETLLVNDPDVAGDDAVLMNDCLVTHTVVENCLFFYDMQPGAYEVVIYARMPARPEVLSQTNVDEEQGNPHYLVGGEWPGQHQLYVSYAVHIAEVEAAGPNAGLLRGHSGVPDGGSLAAGAALNAVQIRQLVPGDADGDGEVGIIDFLEVLGDWGPCPQPCPPSCPADFDLDCEVGIDDFLILLGSWTT